MRTFDIRVRNSEETKKAHNKITITSVSPHYLFLIDKMIFDDANDCSLMQCIDFCSKIEDKEINATMLADRLKSLGYTTKVSKIDEELYNV